MPPFDPAPAPSLQLDRTMWGLLFSTLILSSAASLATSTNDNDDINSLLFAGPESDDENVVADVIGSSSSYAAVLPENDNGVQLVVEDPDAGGSTISIDAASRSKQIINTASASGGAQSSSQPLRTLKRLQAMLEDSDYVTQSVADSSSLSMPSSSSSSMINSASETDERHNENNEGGNKITASSTVETKQSSPPQVDKLWTYKDRAKYRATTRSSTTTSKRQQQQQQHRQHQGGSSDEESSARTIRNLERQQIVQEERERKREYLLLLGEQHTNEEELRPQQQQVVQQKTTHKSEEGTDITDDDTDDAYGYYGGIGGGGGDSKTSGSMGFELPNLPIHLSDGENTEDEEEEHKDGQIISGSSSLGNRRIYEEQQQNPRVMQQQQQQQQKMTHIPHPTLPGAVGGSVIGQQSPYYNSPQAHQGQNNQQQQQQQQQQQWQQSSPSFHSSNSKGNYQSSQHQQQYPQYLHHNMPHQQQQHQQPHPQEQQQLQQQAMPLSPPYPYNSHTLPPRQQQQHQSHLQYDQDQYAAWAQAAAAATNGYYYPGMSPPSGSPYQAMTHQQQQQQQQQKQHQSHQFPLATNPPLPQLLQNLRSAPYAIADRQLHNPSHLQQQQQQHQGGPYSHVLPEQQERAALYRSQFTPPLQLQQQQQQHSESIYYQGGDNIGGERLQQNHLGLSLDDNINNRRLMEWPTSQQQPQQYPYYTTPAYETENVGDSDYKNETVSINTLQDDVSANAAPSTSTTRNESMTIIQGKQTGMKINSVLISPWSRIRTSSGTSSSGTLVDTSLTSTAVANTPRQLLSDADELVEQEVYISGANTKLTVDSIQRISFIGLSMALLSYFAVSPRSLPFPEYNRLFLQNFSTVGIGTIAPIVTFLAVFDGRYNNINTAIGTCHISFSLGYALTLILEIFVTTAVRLGVFSIWEPSIFFLTPSVPSIILPWVLREKQYKPKRITLFAADFCASCLASPIIEEYMKLKVVQWSCKLPRNFKKTYNQPRRRRGGRNNHSLQQIRNIDAAQVTNINCYITQMLAASIGMKLFDVTRRILMYTKDTNMHKRTYALCRGTFPIHELCGTMTALMLARRDVLGVNLPQWQILGPAVFIHGMANFRGMKPIFKWNSSTPWSEMQLSQLTSGGTTDQIWKELLPKSYAKLVWLTILCRVYGFCVKNYYLIGRQAMKRTTTYSGKLHAFNAKLQTDAMLKKIKSD